MAVQAVVGILLESRIYFFSFLVFGLICYLLSRWRQTSSIYHQFEHVGNPWWLPKVLGKGPQTLFAEGYNNVSIILGAKFKGWRAVSRH
jgi:hypothetical protein